MGDLKLFITSSRDIYLIKILIELIMYCHTCMHIFSLFIIVY